LRDQVVDGGCDPLPERSSGHFPIQLPCKDFSAHISTFRRSSTFAEGICSPNEVARKWFKEKNPADFPQWLLLLKAQSLDWADHRCRKAIFELAQPFKAENYAD
jgi:hypothetical protein